MYFGKEIDEGMGYLDDEVGSGGYGRRRDEVMDVGGHVLLVKGGGVGGRENFEVS